jgi:hypothetical protein
MYAIDQRQAAPWIASVDEVDRLHGERKTAEHVLRSLLDKDDMSPEEKKTFDETSLSLERINLELRNIADEPQVNAARAVLRLFSPIADHFVELPPAIRQTAIGRLAQRAAYCLEFPEASVFLALLGTASAAVSTAYAVQYRTGKSVAAGIYAVIEQPPATQKSYLLDIGLSPYERAIREHNRRVMAHNAGCEERADHLAYAFGNTTDATAAALDMALSECSEGRFVIASAEQSAFASLFPESGAFSSNNELALKGYAGEFVSSIRKGRAAFNGVASGAIVLVAQPGSAKRVFTASAGTGLAERFLYLSEPSLLGRRDLHGDYLTREERAAFESACAGCVAEYSSRILADVYDGQPLDPECLIQLRASPGGYDMILAERRRLEPRLGALEAKGERLLLSWLGKIETHALKIAAVLHVIECRAAGCTVPEVIPSPLIQAALELAGVFGDHLEQLLHASGESGTAAEVEAVFTLLSEKKRLGATAAVMALKNRAPFKAMGKGAYKAARARIDAMLAGGLLFTSTNGDLNPV